MKVAQREKYRLNETIFNLVPASDVVRVVGVVRVVRVVRVVSVVMCLSQMLHFPLSYTHCFGDMLPFAHNVNIRTNNDTNSDMSEM